MVEFIYEFNPLLHELFKLLGYQICVVLDREHHAVECQRHIRRLTGALAKLITLLNEFSDNIKQERQRKR